MKRALCLVVLAGGCSTSSSAGAVHDDAGCATGCDAAVDVVADADLQADATVLGDAAAADAAVDAPLAPDAAAIVDATWMPADVGWAPTDGARGTYDGSDPFPDFAACQRLGMSSVDEVSTKLIVPRCGGALCHQTIFPPRHLDHPAMFRQLLVDQRSQILCKSDRYIDRANVAKSFMLTKVWATTEDLPCPSGGAANSGGSRMPNAMAGLAGPRLSDDELGCYTWWVFELAK